MVLVYSQQWFVLYLRGWLQEALPGSTLGSVLLYIFATDLELECTNAQGQVSILERSKQDRTMSCQDLLVIQKGQMESPLYGTE